MPRSTREISERQLEVDVRDTNFLADGDCLLAHINDA